MGRHVPQRFRYRAEIVLHVVNSGELAMSDSTYPNSPKVSGSGNRAADGASHSNIDHADDLMVLLSRVVQRDIVPNLITANRIIGEDAMHFGATAHSAWHDVGFNAERGERDMNFVGSHVRMADVARFVRLLRSTGVDAAPALVEVLLSRGIRRSELYLDLLGPAARLVGDMWLDDECSFADVTMVVGRLHNILNSLRGEQAAPSAVRCAPDVLLSVAPGEQHSFGIAIVDAVFQDAGWSTTLSHTNDADLLLEQVSARRFDAVGVSLSNECLKDALRVTIMRLRAASANRDLLVLVGGPAFALAPSLAIEIGADALVGSGLDAAIEARSLLPRQVLLAV
ncbi:MAG: cobalamin B12-binding domain-containing protein [Bosea sp. (in: a-proteobacteria)]